MKKKKLAFDNTKYVKIQKKAILDRVSKYDKKLYLEFGGKLFDDYHAARVLPGFEKGRLQSWNPNPAVHS